MLPIRAPIEYHCDIYCLNSAVHKNVKIKYYILKECPKGTAENAITLLLKMTYIKEYYIENIPQGDAADYLHILNWMFIS